MELIENNVYRHEAWFEAITLYLNLDKAEDLCICKNGIAVVYKDGTTKYFDEYLNVIENAMEAQSLSAEGQSLSAEGQSLSTEGLLENTDQHYLVTKDSIELHRTGSPYVSKRKIGNIKQHMAIDDLLFILTDGRLVIVKFT